MKTRCLVGCEAQVFGHGRKYRTDDWEYLTERVVLPLVLHAVLALTEQLYAMKNYFEASLDNKFTVIFPAMQKQKQKRTEL